MEEQYNNARHALLPIDHRFRDQTFSLPMPPPNITGKLHLGHALDLNLQDTIIRWYAQHGASTRWTPGSDHAGLATHEKLLQAYPHLQEHTAAFGQEHPSSIDAEDHTRFDQAACPSHAHRDAAKPSYQEAAQAWTKNHQTMIFQQFSALHPYTDLASPRFTMDAAYQKHGHNALLALKPYLYWHEGSLMLDLRDARYALIAALQSNTIACEPIGHRNRLIAMLNEDRPWDIGRSIPWGLRIPAWCMELPGSNPEMQTLDTWFNSSLWPSAMHPNEATPLNALITGYDIAFFWGARMCMMHYTLYKSWPFTTIRLHGLIRDKEGRKFSKSLGNGIDPLDIIAKEGSDALRIWCLENAAWGRDLRCNREDFMKALTLPTKMLNATRWLQMQKPLDEAQRLDGNDPAWQPDQPYDSDAIDRTLAEHMTTYALDTAWKTLKKQAWSQWCEGWLMAHKDRIKTDIRYWDYAWRQHWMWLARLHPFMPMSTWWIMQQIQEW